MVVAVRDVLVRDRAQVPRPGDQHPEGRLGAGGTYPALGISVRSRAARRDLHHLDPGTRQHRAECAGELPGPVPDQEPEPGGPLPRAHQRVPGLLGARAVRVRGHAQDKAAAHRCAAACGRP
jgi:hypothetical protein